MQPFQRLRTSVLSTDKKQAEEIAQARADFLGGSPIVNSFEFDEIP